MAKSKSRTTNLKQPATELVTAPASSVRRLVVTLPILTAVLFTIGYLQIGNRPLTDQSSTPKAQQASKAVSVSDTPALQIAPQTQEKLAPLAVTVTDGTLSPTGSGNIGDTNASAAAQPTVTSLQAPLSAIHSDDKALQASKHSDDSSELQNL